MNTPALERLRAFRQAIYTTFGCRRDALFEILNALLTTPVIEHPAHLCMIFCPLLCRFTQVFPPGPLV